MRGAARGAVLLAAVIAAAGGILATRSARSAGPAAPSGVADPGRRASIRSFWDAFRRAEAARLSRDPARLAEAEESYREALAIDPDHETSLWELANVLAQEGKREEAIALLRRHIETHPRSTRGFARLGDLLSSAGPGAPADLDGAEAMYRKAVALNPEESGGYVNLGRLLYLKGDLDGAEASFRSALKINFKSLVAARHLALIACRRGEPRRAAREIAPVLERFLADKPKLYALSEGDTIESEREEDLTPSAREIFPAAEFLWLLARSGAAEAGAIPAGVTEIAARPLPPLSPAGRSRLEVAAPEIGSAPPARVLKADLDGDGIEDRFDAGGADGAEAAAWILTGKAACRGRAALLERGLGGGRFEPLPPDRFPRACLPGGSVEHRDVNGDGIAEIVVNPGGGDPARIEPAVVFLRSGGVWAARTLVP